VKRVDDGGAGKRARNKWRAQLSNAGTVRRENQRSEQAEGQSTGNAVHDPQRSIHFVYAEPVGNGVTDGVTERDQPDGRRDDGKDSKVRHSDRR